MPDNIKIGLGFAIYGGIGCGIFLGLWTPLVTLVVCIIGMRVIWGLITGTDA